ncbi:cytochrome c biogenesis protein CcdA [Gemmata sp. JC717]|uniref:protein-disulfide reductase DsbD family protein n=1 Tax=Gemmata algarum TaxID=2975278 RepID=UPI0021BB1774|nr:cytochrome c biogenesis protein CcdA [Gemmata algarum]MDY3555849.1 cytochrome c biogenesis protein CcdA [Gemmata algarum]
MVRSALPLAAFALFVLAAPAGAQPDIGAKGNLPKEFAARASVSVEVVPAKAKRGETVLIKLTVAPRPEAHAWTYPAFPKDGEEQLSRNALAFPPPGDLIFVGKLADPAVAWKEKPRDTGVGLDQYTEAPVTWELKAVVSPKAAVGPKAVLLEGIRLQVCDARKCILADGRKLPPAEFTVEDGESTAINAADYAEATKAPPPAPKEPAPPSSANGAKPPASAAHDKVAVRKTAKPTDAYAAEMKAFETRVTGAEPPPPPTLWAFVATAAAWGLISLVTPCVFPMIPITVSIFLKQAHGSLGERLKLASVYCLTIITVLGLSAFTLLKFMAWLSTHPVTNVLLGALFFVLALSLFGMYDIGLPNALQKRLQAKQSKGGVVGTIFGALAFTVISFTCVAPFLGGFAGIAGSDSSFTVKEIAGGLAFATAFAAPFFVLALVPGLLKALPRSGGWLDSVKVVMGFLELAAALKFLRTAELRLLPSTEYFTFDLVLGGWVAISFACGLYLLNAYRLPHDEEQPNIGVPRLIFALLFLGLSAYLAPALLKFDGKPQRPSGAVYAWVEAFLLPEDKPTESGADEVWRTDLQEALDASKKSGQPVFVDFTGVTCTNCKYNEHFVFPQLAVREELQKFEKVRLYTDEVPEQYYLVAPGRTVRQAEAAVNSDFQIASFKTSQLPLYAVLAPQPNGNVKVIGVYEEGKINDAGKFAAFLKESREKAKR